MTSSDAQFVIQEVKNISKAMVGKFDPRCVQPGIARIRASSCLPLQWPPVARDGGAPPDCMLA